MIKSRKAKKVKIAKKGFVWDYPMPKDMGLSIQELEGRVPDNGRYRNRICDEVCYVISGRGRVFIDDRKFEVRKGDVYSIKPGQKSYLIAKKLKLITITRPNWYSGQCEIVDKSRVSTS